MLLRWLICSLVDRQQGNEAARKLHTITDNSRTNGYSNMAKLYVEGENELPLF